MVLTINCKIPKKRWCRRIDGMQDGQGSKTVEITLAGNRDRPARSFCIFNEREKGREKTSDASLRRDRKLIMALYRCSTDAWSIRRLVTSEFVLVYRGPQDTRQFESQKPSG